MYRSIGACRVCGNRELVALISLGMQALTGKFPRAASEQVGHMPLELVKCVDAAGGCGLVQLRHSGDLSAMYGEHYGYRSGLNQSMVRHLNATVQRVLSRVPIGSGDLVVDIGSNDSTLLQAYPHSAELVGVDPSGPNFARFYPSHVRLVPTFFSAEALRAAVGKKKAKIVTSISMFYDLDDPQRFVDEVCDSLDEDGLWVFEQSYLPTMLAMNSYDTICHEHLEYYALKQVKWMTDRAGLKIVDISFNSVNGGSFAVTAAKKGSVQHSENTGLVEDILRREEALGLQTVTPYQSFEQRVLDSRIALRGFLEQCKSSGKRVLGYGASTKGNVLLQFCQVTAQDLTCIAEVNSEKFGCVTPGTRIPIVSEADAKAMRPDYFLVLPWHFRDSIVEREQVWLQDGGRLVFPLPQLEIVGAAAR